MPVIHGLLKAATRSAAAVALALAAGAVIGDDVAASKETQMAASTRGDEVSIEGVRLTQGDAVNCAEVRTDDGASYFVDSLPGDIGIGDRVRIAGTMGFVIGCRGLVLVPRDVTVLARGTSEGSTDRVPRLP